MMVSCQGYGAYGSTTPTGYHPGYHPGARPLPGYGSQAYAGVPQSRGYGAPAYTPSYAPRATIGLDVDGDGRADYLVSGVDRNRDGIPDALQVIVLPVQTVLPVTMASGCANVWWWMIIHWHALSVLVCILLCVAYQTVEGCQCFIHHLHR